jgi:hypothetical protein
MQNILDHIQSGIFVLRVEPTRDGLNSHNGEEFALSLAIANLKFWQIVFETGRTPQGQVVMPQGINLMQMIQRNAVAV